MLIFCFSFSLLLYTCMYCSASMHHSLSALRIVNLGGTSLTSMLLTLVETDIWGPSHGFFPLLYCYTYAYFCSFSSEVENDSNVQHEIIKVCYFCCALKIGLYLQYRTEPWQKLTKYSSLVTCMPVIVLSYLCRILLEWSNDTLRVPSCLDGN